MKYFDWDKKKNEKIKGERNISFDEILIAIQTQKLLDTIEHPNKSKFANQKIFVVKINNYVYMVPYVEDEEKYFLKTIFPSRKMTKKYLKGGEK